MPDLIMPFATRSLDRYTSYMDRYTPINSPTMSDSDAEESLNSILSKPLPKAAIHPRRENEHQDESRDEEHSVRMETEEVDDVHREIEECNIGIRPIDKTRTTKRVTFVEDVIIQIYQEDNAAADDDDKDATIEKDRNIFDVIFCLTCS
jgi:hypothetical protein